MDVRSFKVFSGYSDGVVQHLFLWLCELCSELP